MQFNLELIPNTGVKIGIQPFELAVGAVFPGYRD
jgi:hypothetical protein